MAEETMRDAAKTFEREARVRMIVKSAVAEARHGFGPIDPERAERDATELAMRAAAVTAHRIYNEDAELRALRYERDHYKAIAEQTVRAFPVVYVLAGAARTSIR